MKPTLAGEAVLDKLQFPIAASPKLDGLRGLVHEGRLLSRSLKLIPNEHTQGLLAREAFNGFDGELIVGAPTAKDVYRQSSSALMRIAGYPAVTYFVFDLHDHAGDYMARRAALESRVIEVRAREALRNVLAKISIVLLPQKIVHDLPGLLAYENELLEEGYEGVILRDPTAPYKFGRSSTNEGYLLKLKRFTDAEAEVIGFEEQMQNNNEKQTNELGRTKRSTAKAGLSGKNTLGALECRDLVSGVVFNIGTGFDDATKQAIWNKRAAVKGKIVKYKSFQIGVKDAPRHPVFLGFRDARDMS
jgi:DNA ligase-1